MTSPRCLVLTQEPALRALAHVLLGHGAYDRKHVATAAAAQNAIDEWRPHLIILDIDIDDGKGIELVDGWKRRGEKMPIIGLTRRDTIESRLEAFQRGIDDLLVVPFAPEELVARGIGVMRRVHGIDVQFIPEIAIGNIRIDLLHERLRADDRELALTKVEKSLLYVLASNAGEVMSRERLLDHIWGFDRDVGANLIDRHIADLRAKLGDDRHEPRFIETIPGRGYRFKGGAVSPPAAP